MITLYRDQKNGKSFEQERKYDTSLQNLIKAQLLDTKRSYLIANDTSH